jgi:carbon-monoxide dehydrogenase medium subunit
MVGVAALLELDGDTVTSARVGANGVVDHGVRLEAVEETLLGERLDDATIEAAAERATDDVDTTMLMDDIQASGQFRLTLLAEYTERALRTVTDRVSAPAAAD